MLTQILLLVICQTIVADNSVNKPYYDVENGTLIRDLFENFIETNSRNYDGAEKEERFQIFVESLKKINSLNKEYEAVYDVNFFADLRPEERERYFGFNPVGPLDDYNSSCKIYSGPTTKSAPASWDWRDHNIVTPIKNQRDCGSCYAFAATGVVESRYLAKYRRVLNLSEQQLVDCDVQSRGCCGGWPGASLTYIMAQGGQESSSDYPYEADCTNGCRFDGRKVVAKVASCSSYQLTSEDALKELLYQEGPLAITVAANTWHEYNNTIHDNCNDKQVNHAVLLVGYGSEYGKDYWIIKNSWGTVWGLEGYIKLRRGVNCDYIISGLEGSVVSATVV